MLVDGIPVEINYDGEQYIVINPKTSMYGVGDTLDKAIKDFYSVSHEYYNDLMVDENKLGGKLPEHLTYLRKILEDDI